jgi:hypothetical protein
VVARRRQCQDGEGFRGLPGGEGYRGDPAFEGGDALLEDVLGGVVDPGVDVARLGQREQVGGVLGVAEDERAGLVIGVARAPVVGSGTAPTWTCLVSNDQAEVSGEVSGPAGSSAGV